MPRPVLARAVATRHKSMLLNPRPVVGANRLAAFDR
jgi:hypothetical protein